MVDFITGDHKEEEEEEEAGPSSPLAVVSVALPFVSPGDPVAFPITGSKATQTMPKAKAVSKKRKEIEGDDFRKPQLLKKPAEDKKAAKKKKKPKKKKPARGADNSDDDSDFQ